MQANICEKDEDRLLIPGVFPGELFITGNDLIKPGFQCPVRVKAIPGAFETMQDDRNDRGMCIQIQKRYIPKLFGRLIDQINSPECFPLSVFKL